MMSCAQIDEVEELVLGSLGDEDANRVRAHLSECAECRDAEALFTAERALFARRAQLLDREVESAPPYFAPAVAPAERLEDRRAWLGTTSRALVAFAACAAAVMRVTTIESAAIESAAIESAAIGARTLGEAPSRPAAGLPPSWAVADRSDAPPNAGESLHGPARSSDTVACSSSSGGFTAGSLTGVGFSGVGISGVGISGGAPSGASSESSSNGAGVSGFAGAIASRVFMSAGHDDARRWGEPLACEGAPDAICAEGVTSSAARP